LNFSWRGFIIILIKRGDGKMYWSFLISLAAFTVIYFVLLYSTRFILKDLSEKRYKQIRENLKIPLLYLLINIALLIPFYYLKESNELLAFLNHFFKNYNYLFNQLVYNSADAFNQALS
jgi:hypothetical protein